MNDEKKINPQNCPYNGQTEEECQCDECDHFLECYPVYESISYKTKLITDRSKLKSFEFGISGSGGKIVDGKVIKYGY